MRLRAAALLLAFCAGANGTPPTPDCAGCHPAESKLHAATRMAHAIVPALQSEFAQNLPDRPVRESGNGYMFTYHRIEKGIEVRAIRGTDDADGLIEWVFGAGAQGQTPLVRTSGAIACPDDTGSHLSYDGTHLYVSQWYNKQLLELDPAGNPKLDMTLVGTGNGSIFRDGKRQDVTWTRPDIFHVFTPRNPSDAAVQPAPGQTLPPAAGGRSPTRARCWRRAWRHGPFRRRRRRSRWRP